MSESANNDPVCSLVSLLIYQLLRISVLPQHFCHCSMINEANYLPVIMLPKQKNAADQMQLSILEKLLDFVTKIVMFLVRPRKMAE